MIGWTRCAVVVSLIGGLAASACSGESGKIADDGVPDAGAGQSGDASTANVDSGGNVDSGRREDASQAPDAGSPSPKADASESGVVSDGPIDAAHEPVERTFVYENPIHWNGDEELRDPCIIREGDTYYLVFTVFPFTNNDAADPNKPDYGSSPGIKMYSSTDLTHWTFVKWLVKSSELPESSPYKHRFWAPELHKIGGKFYLVFTADNWIKDSYNPAGHMGGYAFIGIADQVTGPYEHISYLEGGAIDTSLFEASDGKTYTVIPHYEIDVQEIDLTKITQGQVKLLGSATRIIHVSDQDVGIDRQAKYLEGPFVTLRGGKYYAFYAANFDDGYWTGVAYADSPLGPYTEDKLGSQFFWGGHSVLDGPDHRFWFSYRGEKFRDSWGRLGIDPIDMDDKGMLTPVGPTYQQQITVKC